MSSFLSIVPGIRALRIEPFPAKPTGPARAIKVGHTHVAVTDKGVIYSSAVSTRASYVGNLTAFGDTFCALQKLGVISKEDAAAQYALDLEATQMKDLNRDLDSAEKLFERVGIKLTKPQQKAFNKQVAVYNKWATEHAVTARKFLTS